MVKNSLLAALTVLLLAGCERMLIGPDPEDTAGSNFDVLWKTLDEKYGLFPVTDVDWNSLYGLYRSQIDESTTDNELWNICCQLLAPLENGHITLQIKGATKYFTPEFPDVEIFNGFNIDVVRSRYLSGPVKTGEGNITYGRINETNLGYICIHSFGGASNGRDWVRDMADVVTEFSGCDGIIIDVRNNGGGFTRNDLYAASLFIDRDITYYYSRLKTGPGHDDFGDRIAKIVYPRSDVPGFTKKNVVLTNRFTASGAEAFTLICKNLPYSTQIGDTTIGAIGEVSHVAQMPNGWILKYPCSLTVLADGTSPENIGIAPDILINNTMRDVNAGRDRVVEYAIQYLLLQP